MMLQICGCLVGKVFKNILSSVTDLISRFRSHRWGYYTLRWEEVVSFKNSHYPMSQLLTSIFVSVICSTILAAVIDDGAGYARS
jgi:hypothetical protein